jgi:hypothetical protein
MPLHFFVFIVEAGTAFGDALYLHLPETIKSGRSNLNKGSAK